jgi:hypothetical protein
MTNQPTQYLARGSVEGGPNHTEKKAPGTSEASKELTFEESRVIAVFDRMFLVVSGSRLCCWPACDCCAIVEVFD